MPKWTPYDKARLIHGYRSGITVRRLSHDLNRSVDAIYKALRKFNLLAQDDPANDNHQTVDHADASRGDPMARALGAIRHMLTKPLPRLAVPMWVSVDKIYRWLKEEGHHLDPVPQPLRERFGWVFFVDRVPMGEHQILVFANKKRLSKGLNVFYVPTLSA